MAFGSERSRSWGEGESRGTGGRLAVAVCATGADKGAPILEKVERLALEAARSGALSRSGRGRSVVYRARPQGEGAA